MNEQKQLLAACAAVDHLTSGMIAAGCDRNHLGHALLRAAVQALLDVDDERADGLARGLRSLAAVDQQQFLERGFGDAIAEAIKGNLPSEDDARRAGRLLQGSATIPFPQPARIPTAGQAVTFDAGSGRNGRMQATNVRPA